MPILFNMIENESDAVVSVANEDTHKISSYKTTDSVYEFLDITTDYLRAVLEATKANDLAIALEGQRDYLSDSNYFFKEWCRNYDSLSKRLLKDLEKKHYTSSIVTRKYENVAGAIKIPEFTVKGFDYTIDSIRMNCSHISEILRKTDMAADRICRGGYMGSVIQDFLYEMNSNNAMDTYRGSLINMGPVGEKEFPEMLFAAFRNKRTVKKDIICNPQMLYNMYKSIKSFKRIIDGIDVDRETLMSEANKVIIHRNGTSYMVDRPENTYELNRMKNTFTDGYGDRYSKNVEEYKGLSVIYSASNNALRRMLEIYNKFAIAKIKAADEAIQFYVSCLKKATEDGEEIARSKNRI